MRTRRMIPLVLAVLIAAPAMAFHDGGVAECSGCHTMHNSEDGVGVNDDGSGTGLAVGFGYDDLLLFPQASDVCLSCHGGARSYNVFEDAANLSNPTLAWYYSAGNFVFLLEDNINDGYMGSVYTIPGEASGHNIKSVLKGSDWDTTLTAPPGVGSPLANNQLECSSCHDPHGNDGFRLLYQTGQQVEVGGQFVTYQSTIVADGIPYNTVETDSNHNAYQSGYSAWCASCHTGFHNSYGNMIHPSGTTLTSAVVAKYNAYQGTQDCVDNPPAGLAPCGSGVPSTAYLADVPFEDTTMTTTSTAGPTGTSVVACMTCHRAHATSAPNAGRWEFNVTLLEEDGVESGSWAIPRTYTDPDQRSLCNKCHTQDEYDHVTP